MTFGPKMTEKLADYAATARARATVAAQSGEFDTDLAGAPVPVGTAPIRVHGKFFFAGETKHFVKGVTYGPFALGSHGAPFPEEHVVARDFALMRQAGINTVRVFTVPPIWLLDAARDADLSVLVGLPWSQHVAFLDSDATQAAVREAVAGGVRACRRHPAVFAYLVGNEVPPDMIRWHGVEPVRRFLKSLVGLVRREHPGVLVSYANFPSTEYLTIDFTDFLCFNVYLHDEGAFRRYVGRLHNLAVDKPLVLTEFGIDSMHSSEDEQRRILAWQVPAAFAAGVAGTCVFAWTDEWFTGGHLIEDWAFGLVDRDRQPKPALHEVAAAYRGHLPPALTRYPRVSIVVCSYNAERTMEPCLESLVALDYPDYEIIVVNDGSTDRTIEISEYFAARFPSVRIVSQANKGLSVARNVGAEAASGEIVAYTDSDCVADPDWLTYLVARMEEKGLTACGGPNFPPPEDSLVPAAVAVSPGGPTHVLLTDDTAEHIAGCNMAFRRDVLLNLGGFDPIYRAAGDDVDICWRFQDAGYEIGFSPAAVVWHFRRNTVKAYIGQQKGYGKAEALVYARHPGRFNAFGQAMWHGRIYGDWSAAMLLSRAPLIYSGVFGRGLFQTLYAPPAPLAAFLPLTFEWSVASLVLAPLGLAAGGWGWALTLPLLTTWAMCVRGALKAPIDVRFSGAKARALVALLIYLGPLLRGKERLRWRFKALQTEDNASVAEPEQHPRIDWRRRAYVLSYWSENAAEKETLLGGLMDLLLAQKYFTVTDSGWDGWDIAVSRGVWSRALVTVVAENHGADKRLLHLRCALRLSSAARWALGGCAVGAVLAGAAGWPWIAAGIVALGSAGLAATGHRMTVLARLMQGNVEAAACRANLTPVEPIRREPLPLATSPAA